VTGERAECPELKSTSIPRINGVGKSYDLANTEDWPLRRPVLTGTFDPTWIPTDQLQRPQIVI
jgi:hypothetical protein